MTSRAALTGCAIGIDVGGTKIAGGLVDLAGAAILEARTIPTGAQRGGAAVLADALDLAEGLLAAARRGGRVPLGIGIGVPELVDPAGTVKSNHNFDWAGRPVQVSFAKLAPAVVESDVRAAARAECLFGAARGIAQCVYITLGTGISYCLCIDGVPYAGAQGNAIHFASSALAVHCAACGSLQRPVIEDYASGPALVARYTEMTGVAVADAEALFRAADAGDAAAVEVLTTAAESLGALIGLVVNMLDPEAVVIGGGLGLAGGLYGACLVAATRRHVWAADRRDLPILPAGLGPDAGVLGAAAVAGLASH